MISDKLPAGKVVPFEPCDICPVEELCVPERRCRHHSASARDESRNPPVPRAKRLRMLRVLAGRPADRG